MQLITLAYDVLWRRMTPNRQADHSSACLCQQAHRAAGGRSVQRRNARHEMRRLWRGVHRPNVNADLPLTPWLLAEPNCLSPSVRLQHSYSRSERHDRSSQKKIDDANARTDSGLPHAGSNKAAVASDFTKLNARYNDRPRRD